MAQPKEDGPDPDHVRDLQLRLYVAINVNANQYIIPIGLHLNLNNIFVHLPLCIFGPRLKAERTYRIGLVRPSVHPSVTRLLGNRSFNRSETLAYIPDKNFKKHSTAGFSEKMSVPPENSGFLVKKGEKMLKINFSHFSGERDINFL
jgi:hypothetical protein